MVHGQKFVQRTIQFPKIFEKLSSQNPIMSTGQHYLSAGQNVTIYKPWAITSKASGLRERLSSQLIKVSIPASIG
jgi:hypothetical protein